MPDPMDPYMTLMLDAASRPQRKQPKMLSGALLARSPPLKRLGAQCSGSSVPKSTEI